MIISIFDTVENMVEKGENAAYQHFLLFPQCFERASFTDTSKGVTSFPDTSKSVTVREWVTPFPNKPWLLRVCSTSLMKTLWENKKLIITSNSSFSHSVFYPSEKLSAIFINFKIALCKLFQFGRV